MTESKTKITLKGQVAVVTGAGNGMGRCHALLLARHGAHVIVNDYGVRMSGSDPDPTVAQRVVDEIRLAGGEATASAESVQSRESAAAIVDCAVSTYGRIDILVNNAGILINEPFDDLSEETWQRVLDVNLTGSMWMTKAAWPHMKRNAYGRVIFVGSTGGLVGGPGLSAYGTSKGGLFGLMRCLMQEVGDADIKLNMVLPGANTRMAAGASKETLERGNPALVSPMVAYLASRECKELGETYVAGSGFFGRVQVLHGAGVRFGWNAPISPEELASRWQEINDMGAPRSYHDVLQHGAEWFFP